MVYNRSGSELIINKLIETKFVYMIRKNRKIDDIVNKNPLFKKYNVFVYGIKDNEVFMYSDRLYSGTKNYILMKKDRNKLCIMKVKSNNKMIFDSKDGIIGMIFKYYYYDIEKGSMLKYSYSKDKKKVESRLSARYYYDNCGKDKTIGDRCNIRNDEIYKCLLLRGKKKSPYWATKAKKSEVQKICGNWSSKCKLSKFK